ncbi:MAG: acetyl-CoA carboxylase biotin carboxyl carrier protein subunit [Clostridia bacterium]|nr:acetyl-CoA carboxylase biotin carboxyl carrier protein subunit [Clostridia bacterium]
MRNFKVTVNGKEYEVAVEELGASAAPVAAAPQAAAPVQAAPAAPKAAPKAAAPAGGTQLTAPMPGMVLSFKVENGATVKKGQAVMVLEAMKMENDIAAPADGVITFVASKGANVNSGEVLAVIK